MKINFNKKTRKKLKAIGFDTDIIGIHRLPNVRFELPCKFTADYLHNDIEVGLYSYVGRNFAYYSKLKIGRFCSIANNVSIGLHNHPMDRISTSPFFYTKSFMDTNNEQYVALFNDASHPVEIGNDVWIGDSARIKGGVKIGDGAVIATCAVVTKDVEPYSIVGGVPAKVIGERKIKRRFAHKFKPDSILKDFSKFQSLRKRIKSIFKK